MPDPGNVIGSVVTVGAMLTVIGAVVSQTLVPRRAVEQVRHDRDEYRAELRLQRQRIEERENQLRWISQNLRAIQSTNRYVATIEQVMGTTPADPEAHEHDWVEVILPNGDLCNRICTDPECWAEDTKVKAEHVHQASTRQTPATG